MVWNGGLPGCKECKHGNDVPRPRQGRQGKASRVGEKSHVPKFGLDWERWRATQTPADDSFGSEWSTLEIYADCQGRVGEAWMFFFLYNFF